MHNERVTLTMIKKWGLECNLDSIGSGQGPVVSSYEQCSQEFIEQPGDYQLVKKNPVQCKLFVQ
jgi:hypothetical protein